MESNISTTGTCFDGFSTVDNITLDGKGYTVSGDSDGSDYGFNFDGVDSSNLIENMTLKNINFVDFGHSIYIYDFTRSLSILNNTF